MLRIIKPNELVLLRPASEFMEAPAAYFKWEHTPLGVEIEIEMMDDHLGGVIITQMGSASENVDEVILSLLFKDICVFLYKLGVLNVSFSANDHTALHSFMQRVSPVKSIPRLLLETDYVTQESVIPGGIVHVAAQDIPCCNGIISDMLVEMSQYYSRQEPSTQGILFDGANILALLDAAENPCAIAMIYQLHPGAPEAMIYASPEKFNSTSLAGEAVNNLLRSVFAYFYMTGVGFVRVNIQDKYYGYLSCLRDYNHLVVHEFDDVPTCLLGTALQTFQGKRQGGDSFGDKS